MEKYRKKIKRTIAFGIVIMAAAVGLFVLSLLAMSEVIPFLPGNPMLLGFQTGLLMGFAAVAMYYVFRCARALKDPKKLQMLFNDDHDERKAFIRQKAGMPMIGFTSGAIVFAAIIAGYFNTVVFQTLIAAALAQLLISAGVKAYYMRAM